MTLKSLYDLAASDKSCYSYIHMPLSVWSDLFLLTGISFKFYVQGGTLQTLQIGHGFSVELPCLFGILTFIQHSVDLTAPIVIQEKPSPEQMEQLKQLASDFIALESEEAVNLYLNGGG